jgi:NDP-sugar pyrophosphorylase family protein
MRAMILAAGRGERARPLSDRIPKPLFPVGGHPLIAYPLGLLKAAGVTEVIVNVHYLAEQIEEALRGCDAMGFSVQICREAYLLETGGGIANARKLIGDSPFFVLNADVICDVDLSEVVDEHIRSGCISTMVLRRNLDPAHIPVVEWDPRTRQVIDIRGDIGRRRPGSRAMMFAGIQIMEPTVFEYILPKRESIIDGFYLPALREHRHVHGYIHEGYWAELGTPESYHRTREELPRQSLKHFQPVPLVSLHESAAG